MEEYSIACLVSLKCDEIKHNNSNCRLYQHSWLLCTFYGEYKAAWTREDLKRGATAGFFYSTQRTAMSERIYFYEVQYITARVNLQFPMLCIGPLTEKMWSIYGTLVLWLDQLQSSIIIFFFERLSISYTPEFFSEFSTEHVITSNNCFVSLRNTFLYFCL